MQKILIIEGDETTANHLAQILEKENYFVKVANTGKQCFEDISSFQFNLVILGLLLPDTSGTEVLSWLRKNYKPEQLPVVVISNISDENQIAALLTMGANDFITQPFSEPILILKLRNLLQLQHVTEELNKNNEVLKDVIENIPILSIIVNEDVRVLNTNRMFSSQFEVNYENIQMEFLGNVVKCINAVNSGGQCGKTPECKKCIVRNSVNETLTTGKNIFKREGAFTVKINGIENELTLQLSTTQILYKNSPSVLLNINDVTNEKKYLNELKEARDKFYTQTEDLKQKEQILTEQKKQLQDLNVTKDKFLSIITHDLRNPFVSLLGFSEVLYNKSKSMPEEKREKYIGFIYETSKNTYDLLEDLLTWARSQSGKITVNPQKLNLELIAREITTLLQPSATQKKINLQNEITHEIYVCADSNMLNTVLRNLITNAIKYTKEKGTITLAANTQLEMAEITVSDTGTGMADKTKDTLFKIGETKSRLGTDNEKGTGLGLILCKEFVEKLGGQISVESELNVGSRFTFTIPLWENTPNALTDKV